MSKEIFISYKSEEYDDAFWVKTELEKQGLSCWMAPMDISGGTSYATEIPKAIKNCKVFVLILSKGAQESKWVPRELDQAINENKIIMPFTIKKCTLQADFSFYLTNVQRYDAFLNKKSAMEALTRDIKKHLGIKEKPVEKTVTVDKDTKPAEPEKTAEQKALEQRMQKAIDAGMKKHRQKQKRKELFANPKLKVGIIAGVVVFFVLCVILNMTNTVKIAGEKYNKTESYIELKDKNLTAEDIEGISKLNKLSSLYIRNCTFSESDIGAIVNENLRWFALENCELTEAQVESIDLSSTDLWSCDLSGNKNLTSLDVIEPVVDTLGALDISNTSVTDLTMVASCANLEDLRADGNGISDLSPLANCINLEVLSLNGNGLTSLAGLENATVLCNVYLNDNNLEDVSVLAKSAASLQRLFVRNNQISDISFMETCVVLKYVGLDNNKIASLASMQNISGLKELSAAGNQLTDTTGIEGRRRLGYLDLSNNNITNVGGTEGIIFDDESFPVLDLSNNPLETVNVSYSKAFDFISLANCKLTDYSFMDSIDGYELVITYNEMIDFNKIEEKSYYSVFLIGCPLDQQVSIGDILGKNAVSFVEEGQEIYKAEDNYSYEMKGYIE